MPRNPRPVFNSRPIHRPVPEKPNFRSYRVDVQMINGVNEHDSWYWHLFYKGVKVNGGICDSENQAYGRAEVYKTEHHSRLYFEQHLWDEESSRWLVKGNVVL
jgi:hypothetical protein